MYYHKTNQVARERNGSIECYRCLLMLGICLLHTVGFCGPEWWWLSSMLAPCVVGFVFITGYFGCEFSFKKVIKLFGIAIYCKIVACAIGEIVYCDAFSIMNLLVEAWHEIIICWFLHAYILLMIMSPIINLAIDNACAHKSIREVLAVFGPFLISVFVWGFMADYNCTVSFIPRTPGLTAYSGITLVGIYIVSRIMRFCDVENRISTPLVISVLVISLFVASLRFGGYNSLASIMIASSTFFIFKRIRLSNALGKYFCFLGPSMFSVFMIHCVRWINVQVPNWVAYISCLGIPTFFSMFFLAIIFFGMGIILDLPRRFIARLFAR